VYTLSIGIHSVVDLSLRHLDDFIFIGLTESKLLLFLVIHLVDMIVVLGLLFILNNDDLIRILGFFTKLFAYFTLETHLYFEILLFKVFILVFGVVSFLLSGFYFVFTCNIKWILFLLFFLFSLLCKAPSFLTVELKK